MNPNDILILASAVLAILFLAALWTALRQRNRARTAEAEAEAFANERDRAFARIAALSAEIGPLRQLKAKRDAQARRDADLRRERKAKQRPETSAPRPTRTKSKKSGRA